MTAALSFIVASDAWEHVDEVVACLREQTIAARLELVLVTPGPVAVPELPELAGVVHVTGPVDDVPRAHALGVVRASAPAVFLGETHAFPAADALERLAARLADPSVAVAVPKLANGNPETARSWALFLIAYRDWATSAEGDLRSAAAFNSTWRRVDLAELGDRLEAALGAGGGADAFMRRGGRRIVAEPRAVVAHRNVVAVGACMRSRLDSARCYAAARGASWSRARRLVYALGAPLLCPLVAVRVRRSRAWSEVRTELPAGTTAAVVLLAAVTAVGEGLGYALGAGQARRRIAEFEIRRANYT